MKWNVTMVAIIKNEAPYIADWILYHISLGVDHFLIYDNGSDDGTQKQLTKFINGGRVTSINWPMRAGQLDAYNHALKLLRGNAEWIGFLDVDEFVVLESHNDIYSFLTDLDADEALLPWRNFPYAGHAMKPGGTPLENYFWAHRVPEGGVTQVKHFVRSAAAEKVTAHFSFVTGGRIKRASGEPNNITHAVSDPTYRGAHINHYATRSFSENQDRLRKGQVSGSSHKRAEEFLPMTEALAQRLIYDDAILRHFENFKVESRRWAGISDYPHRFGLQQTGRQLWSANNIIFYAAKSFCNYLLDKQVILPTTDMKVISRVNLDEIRDLTHILFDYTHPILHFAIDLRPYMRFFQGTIHYGDFVRRYGFECQLIRRQLTVASLWSEYLVTSGAGFFAIIDIASEEGMDVGVRLKATSGENLVEVNKLTGRNCVIIYLPELAEAHKRVEIQITGSASVREVLVGSFL